MKILFTGISSFTGYWFANYLLNSGHSIVATFTKKGLQEYDGLRKIRIEKLQSKVLSAFGVSFGNEKFLNLIKNENFDLVCHHGAEVSNYRSFEFNVSAAYENNTFNIIQVLKLIKQKHSKLIITGSVFEGNEGLGSGRSLPFSPYGLSKQLSSLVFEYYCSSIGVPLAKFVIPNPFGPFEEERFTTFLVKSWIKGEKPVIKTPLYIRDNIHVSLLAACYAKFCTEFGDRDLLLHKINPSGYVESQGQFTKRFAKEIEKRLNLNTSFELINQSEFSEPILRINNDPAIEYVNDWSEEKSWDELAKYYRTFL